MSLATMEASFVPPQAVRSTPPLDTDIVHPRDVLDAPALSWSRKRALLAAWASDASAVANRPALRWLIGTPRPVLLDEIRQALDRLDDLATLEDWKSYSEDDAVAAPTIIEVGPFGDDWAVSCDEISNAQLFLSGRRAEQAARCLAERLARAGRWAEIRIRLRNGDTAGRFLCAPDGSAGASGAGGPARPAAVASR